MTKKTLVIKPNNSVYLTVTSLPLSLHKLRILGHVVIEQIEQKQLVEIINNEINSKGKATSKNVETKKIEKQQTTNKKKGKSDNEEVIEE
jgi:hypothetical protein